ncbi:hydroxyacid dehydrogenase [Labrys sp. KNU-23]|uniref:hydroxyacid dehydrogenase n=1 Tax=Labrys sp. KNU-23 TaxID=2789216 RepID=UPI0011ED213D|nr:hydroxyacid dehydrogenase [Labrys sp. KNU-23]QEN89723.1 hydroxyacid dehydrogenase [Labrys sp. KNU-23]
MAASVILVDPLPRTLEQIMAPPVRARLERLGRLVISESRPMNDDEIEALLPHTVAIIGQTAMPRERLERAPRLKAIINVETNFLPNIDYAACLARGIWVLTPASAFAAPVAEATLGLALDLARGISAADRAFRTGVESYGLEANLDTIRFEGAPVGIIGFGDLGRKFRELIRPFRNEVRVYDPWLPAEIIERLDCRQSDLDTLLERSRFVMVFAAPTTENAHFIGAPHFARMQKGSAFLLMSRAAVVDFPAMLAAARSGHIRVATDVFPVEPVPADDPVRATPNMVFSAHRTGGTTDALFEIGSMTVADLELILKDLPPQLCRRADPSIAGRLRSQPVSKT